MLQCLTHSLFLSLSLSLSLALIPVISRPGFCTLTLDVFICCQLSDFRGASSPLFYFRISTVFIVKNACTLCTCMWLLGMSAHCTFMWLLECVHTVYMHVIIRKECTLYIHVIFKNVSTLYMHGIIKNACTLSTSIWLLRMSPHSVHAWDYQ